MKIKEFVKKIEKIAPIEVSEAAINMGHYDNSGFLIGSRAKELTGVVVCVDVCNDAIDMCIENGLNLIWSHHPFIYTPIKNITTENMKGRLITRLIKNDISVYSSHLSMDLTYGGIDEKVAEFCKIHNPELYSDISTNDIVVRYGRLGTLEEEQTFGEYIESLYEHFDVIHSWGDKNEKILTAVSFCGQGADNDSMNFAIEKGVDVFISCDIPHHIKMELIENGIKIIELQHGESELKAFWEIAKSLEKETSMKLCETDFKVI